MPSHSMRHRIWDMVNRRQGAAVRPAFALAQPNESYGVDWLYSNRTLTANSTSVSPILAMYGGDIGASSITPQVGNTLSIAGSGSMSLNYGSPGLGSNDDSALFPGDRRYEDSGTSFGNLSSDDLVIEVVFKAPASFGSNEYFIDKREGSGAYTGYDLLVDGSGNLDWVMDGGVTSVTTSGGALSAGAWYHAMVFADTSESTAADSCTVFLNGTAGTPQNISGVGDMDAAVAFKVGDLDYATNGFTGAIAWIGIWHQSGWFAGSTNDTDWAAIAAERSARFWGYYEQRGQVTTRTPSTSTRSTVAWHPKVESDVVTFYPIAPGVHNVCQIIDSAGTPATTTGFMLEDSYTNLFTRSGDLSHADWSVHNGVVSGTTASSHQGHSLYGIVGDATDAQHGVYQNKGSVDTYFAMFEVKAGDQNFCYIFFEGANTKVWFNLSTGAVGTQEAGIADAGIAPLGGGRYLIYAKDVLGAAQNISINAASADNTATFTGDASTVNLYAGHAQLATSDFPHSWIETTTGSVAADDDNLTYATAGGYADGGKGALVAEMWTWSHDNAGTRHIATLSDGTTADEYRFSVESDEAARMRVTAASSGQADIADPSTELTDGTKHTVRTDWAADSCRVFIDSSSDGTDDTSMTAPTSIDSLDVGQYSNDANQLNGLVGNILIYNEQEQGEGK